MPNAVNSWLNYCHFHSLRPLLLCFSVTQSCPILQPHGLQHARTPCPSPSPRACSNTCSLSQWCHPTTSCSVVSSFPAFNLSQHQGLFQWIGSSHQVAKVLELQLQHQSFQWIFSTNFFWDWLVWFPCNLRDSQESSPAPQFESINSSVFSFFIVQFSSHPDMFTGKTIAFTIQLIASKVMSLLFNNLT